MSAAESGGLPPETPLEKALRVAVIVPVHNAAAYLNECLASVAAQSHQHLLCLLVENGSTDASAGLCAHFAARDPRFTLLRVTTAGPGAARAAGLRAAAGRADYIAFADADDLCHPRLLAALLHAATGAGLPLACCRFAPFTAAPGPNLPPPADYAVLRAPDHCRALLHDKRMDYSLCNKLYRADHITPELLDNGYRYNEDLYANWQIFRGAAGAAFCDFVGYHYRQHGGSASHRAHSPESITQQREIAARIRGEAAGTPCAEAANSFYYEKLTYLASMILRRRDAAPYAAPLDELAAALREGLDDPALGKNPALPRGIRLAALATVHCRGPYRLLCRALLRDRQ